MSMRSRGNGSLGAAVAIAIACGCDGPQSALAPAGEGASRIADLFWVMIVGTAVIWFVVTALAIYAVYRRESPSPPSEKRLRYLVVGGGVIVPALLLAVLLTHGLATLPGYLAPAPQGSLTVHVTGHQWWWRVRYPQAGADPIELANEIHVPAGAPVELELDSGDVIHSFWVPSLGGKVDMIPGHRTRLRLEPTKVGVYRGACAEYCGTSHALMAFYLVVEAKEDFERWLAKQAEPVSTPTDGQALRGRDRFLANGCGGCHSIRGTEARGVIGPDLTHVGGRISIGAATLGADAASFRRWIGRTKEVKPNVHMPSFGMLSPEDLDAIAAYLESLK